jgi:biotin carboxyl carrier protein
MTSVARIGTEQFEIELTRTRSGAVRARVDDRTLELDLREVEPGVVRIEGDGPSREIEVREDSPGVFEVSLGGRVVRVEFPDRRTLLAAEGERMAGGATRITAPMPGKVVRVLVAEGDAVEAGQGLVVIEAMKMQNQIRAAGPGRVSNVAVRDGAAVQSGDLLVLME